MNENIIEARFEEFSLPSSVQQNSCVAVPTVKGIPFFKYGVHAYYFYNFVTGKGLCVTIKHKAIIKPGLEMFFKANPIKNKYFPKLIALFQKYHFRFSFLEQIMLMTIPHTITEIKEGIFLINLWSYFGYLEVDCKNRVVKYITLPESNKDSVLGSQQFYDNEKDERYFMTYSLKDSLRRITAVDQKVSCQIGKYENKTGNTKSIWSGEFADYMHDLVINKNRQYCVICELGLYPDKNRGIIPSKALILNLQNNRSWTISRFEVAAHAQFDPDDPELVYFSNHNFTFEHSSIYKLLTKATYNVEFKGPASVYKYRLTADGPVEQGVFTHPDLYRLTNFHVFNHAGKKILAATGFPNYIFIAKAETMEYEKLIEIKHPESLQKSPAIIGTFAPSSDGNKLFVQTTRTFQVVDIASGKPELIIEQRYNHTCANHLITAMSTGW